MNRREYLKAVKEDPWRATLLEYHPATKHQAEYWREEPKHIRNPTKAVLEARSAFGEVNYHQTYGTKGKRICNNVAMPPGCEITQKNMKGKRFAAQTTKERRLQRTLRRVDARISPFDKVEASLKKFAEAWKQMAAYST